MVSPGIATVPLVKTDSDAAVHIDDGCLTAHPPEQDLELITTDSVPIAQGDNAKSRGKRKRYPGKGKACGWIETRKTNRKRQKPSEYLVYRWQDSEGKHSRYLKKAIAPKVREMIASGATVAQILEVIPPRKSNESKEV